MSVVTVVQDYFSSLGVDPDTGPIYIELVKNGHSSALQLAKATGTSRTQVYRLLDILEKSGLVSAEQLSYGTLYRALPFENIEGLIASREAEIAAMRNDLTGMVSALQSLTGSGGQKATIQHYYGQSGLKQVNWNLTKADGEFRVFEAAHLSQHLDPAFARRCREQCIAKRIRTYDLTNAKKITSKDVEPIDLTLSESRHIDPTILSINFEVYIYNEVVTLLDYERGHEMAMEIHHPLLHMMMKQLFDAMWRTATPLAVTKR